jgi:ABC-type Fe3+-hydroxamate transport system substrate-binding protein
MTPPKSEAVVTLNGAMLTVMLKLALPLAGVGVSESVTVTVKFEVPVVPLGVPEITPALLKLKPVGKLPDVRLQV